MELDILDAQYTPSVPVLMGMYFVRHLQLLRDQSLAIARILTIEDQSVNGGR